MTDSSSAVDITKGSLVTGLLRLAWPSVLQAVLSNCYTVADFFFIGHLPDKAQAAAGTTAIAASVGLTICLFGLHNIIPAGCNAYSAQFKGAEDKKNLGLTFQAGFWSCLLLSTAVAIAGHIFIENIAKIPNSTPEVTAEISKFLGILLRTSPAFGLLLLIDGFFKSCGNTVYPLKLEVASLFINVALNWLFVFRLGMGISGSASASALSRLLHALVGLQQICAGRLNGIQVTLLSLDDELPKRAMAMFKVGIFQSCSDWLYGGVFTVMMRLAGSLGPAQQAGLGAGMRGLEWLSFCMSEGFLVAGLTSVGNLIGANMQRKAILAAILAASMSSLCGCITGLPFIFYSKQISAMLSDDAEIIKYCSIYVKYQGFASFGVGFEMATYGAFIGAGKAREVFLTNGSMNILRIPLCVACIFGSKNFGAGLAWVMGFKAAPPAITGDFSCIAIIIACTAVAKAALFCCWLQYRYWTGVNFSDAILIEQCVGGELVNDGGDETMEGQKYIQLSTLDSSAHGKEQHQEEQQC
jgi:putative MATE family efflux protein